MFVLAQKRAMYTCYATHSEIREDKLGVWSLTSTLLVTVSLVLHCIHLASWPVNYSSSLSLVLL